MKLLPQQLIRAVEKMAGELPGDATAEDIALALACAEVGCVPLRAVSRGRGYEAIPVSGASFYDPWALAASSTRDVRRNAQGWAQADAVGICFPHGGPNWVLDPDTRKLAKFVQFVDGSFR